MSKDAVTMRRNLNEFNGVQDRLKILKARAAHLCGITSDGQPLSLVVQAALDDMLSANVDPEKIAKRAEFLLRAEKDPAAHSELCALRMEQANNYLLADLNFAAMHFEIVNLKKDERPVIQNTSRHQIQIRHTGQDSGPKSFVKFIPPLAEELLNLRWLVTDEIRVKKVDIYHGDIADAANSTIMLSYDLEGKIEDLCKELAFKTPAQGGFFGAFNTQIGDANKALDIYVPNSRINVKNLPTTNDITLTGNTLASGFRHDVIKAALKYEAGWGKAFMEGPLLLTGRILIPGLDVTNIADEVDPVGEATTSVAEQILQNGWATVTVLGRTFRLEADNTLEPGVCYFEFNKKPGKIYAKPELDLEDKREDYETRKTNEEYRYMKKVFGAYCNRTWRMRSLRIRYRKAA